MAVEIYTTEAGDMLDQICFRHYGAEIYRRMIPRVLDENWYVEVLNTHPILPRGVVIRLPEPPAPNPADGLVTLF
jgi:phage tail protein X